MSSNFLLILGGLAILGLLPLVVSRARALDKRIKEQLAEDEQGPKDPYAQMAELTRVQDAISRQERR
jgi:hypothetical protein